MTVEMSKQEAVQLVRQKSKEAQNPKTTKSVKVKLT